LTIKNRFNYYFTSFFTLFKGVKNLPVLLHLALRKPTDEPIELHLRSGERFYVYSLMDAWIIKETILDRQYEIVSIPLKPEWLIVDIGTALGDYAIWAARQLTSGKVIAVEPFPQSVEIMRKNILLNCVNNIDVTEIAIGGFEGQVGLQFITGQTSQQSTVATITNLGTTTVKAITLGKFLLENNIDHCDYLKMDCEGAEYEILFACSYTELMKIDRICMEVHDGITCHSRDEMIEFLKSNGFKIRLTLNPVHDNLAYLFAER
jgi:FkbM family methyltransferase